MRIFLTYSEDLQDWDSRREVVRVCLTEEKAEKVIEFFKECYLIDKQEWEEYMLARNQLEEEEKEKNKNLKPMGRRVRTTARAIEEFAKINYRQRPVDYTYWIDEMVAS
jgi:hypothetical protein